MKRIISLILSAVLSLLIFNSCGNNNLKKINFKIDKDYSESTSSISNKIGDTFDTDIYNSDNIKPMLFRCEDEKGNLLYLMGTIHISGEANDLIIDKVDDYLFESDSLAVEFDIVAYEKNYIQQTEDLNLFLYKDNSSIKDHMDSDLYERCVDFLKEGNNYYSMLDFYNLSMWAQLIDQEMYNRLDIDFEKGIDRLLINNASENNIPILNIESSTEQYKITNSLTDEYNIYSIENTLNSSTEDAYTDISSMYEAYISGDVDKFTNSVSEEYDDISAEEASLINEYEEKLVINRNNNMSQKAIEYLSSGETVFFAVGCAHLIGESGLIKQLQSNGCTVTQIVS